ncbi:MAG: hypothetical protein NZ954_08790 [Thermofilaceae archaeon]|nr:hypothetical protein [Thermofilaceae archaeon]
MYCLNCFQFFPSCIPVQRGGVLVGFRITFNSFPVASGKWTLVYSISAASHLSILSQLHQVGGGTCIGLAVDGFFQFFPSCIRDTVAGKLPDGVQGYASRTRDRRALDYCTILFHARVSFRVCSLRRSEDNVMRVYTLLTAIVLCTAVAVAVPWDTPLDNNTRRDLERLINSSLRGNPIDFAAAWLDSRVGAQTVLFALILLSAAGGYMKSKSALGGGIILLLYSPLIAFEPLRLWGAACLALGIVSLLIWIFLGK